ncbi:MAG: hypothetical protein EOO38_23715, partial [Cytophagaceae bacterium]
MQPLYALGNNTFSTETQRTIRMWIDECNENHPNCQGQADRNFIPTRLLDVSNKDCIMLVESRATRVREPYTTLSYCWGITANNYAMLRQDTMQDYLQHGIATNSLSASIRDAITITRMLGVKYIWVDALCIIQCSKEDWVYEGSVMLQVYRNSFCNLCATDTIGAEGDMFRARDPKDLFDKGLDRRLCDTVHLLERLIGAAANETLSNLLEKILREAGFLGHIMDHTERHWLLQLITGFYNHVRDELRRHPYITLEGFMERIDLMRKEGLSLPLVQVSGQERGVNLLTAHGS